MPERRVNILGVGNPLMGDDGVGPAAVERLGARGVPPGVCLHDAGLAVTDVLGMLHPADPLIVIDAVRAGGRPGQVHRLRLDVPELDAPGVGNMLSLHELSVVPALRMEALAGRAFGDVTVFGVEPAACGWGEGLSPAVADALERLIDEVVAHVQAASTAPAAPAPAALDTAAPEPAAPEPAASEPAALAPAAPEPAAPEPAALEPAAEAAGHVPRLGTPYRRKAGDA